MSLRECPILECARTRPSLVMERTTKWKPNNIELAPNCPRCASSNTKFCYYNNYSLSQPRYFCKACRRYWTKGGSLRNVPVGGGCRKGRRSSRSTEQDGHTAPAQCTVGSTADADVAHASAKSCSPGDGLASSDNTKIEDGTVLERGKPEDANSDGEDQLRQVYEYIDGQDLVCQSYNGFVLEGILDEQLAAVGMAWPEMGTDLPSFGSRGSMARLQNCDIFSPDDQLRFSADLVSDDWGSFDLSGQEFFTRP